MRRNFRLPEPDEAYLNARGLPWETIIQGSSRWLLVHDYPVPPGYNHPAVSLSLFIDPGYADTQIDMVYFLPHLALLNARAIGALAFADIDGKSWQRWSRHRTGVNPWRPGLDCVETHLLLVDEWLRREVGG